ncbi:MAG: lipid-binding SYLF domain-containing protein [Acidobacteriota bacterium]
MKKTSSLNGTILLPVLFVLVVWLWPYSAFAQKIEPKQLKKAVERSEKSADVLKTIVELPHSGIPRALIDNAHAVGVIPHVVTANFIFGKLSLGYGVISRRNPAGWSLPAYYVFSGAGFGGGDTADIILLFMNETVLSWFQKGRVQMKGEKRPTSGPVGSITDEQKAQTAKANIIAYTLYKGILVGAGLGGGFFKSFLLNPDNNLNKPLYGVKGRDVLAGKEIDPQSVPAGINAFPQALNEYYSLQQTVRPAN